jgi:branched-chain amino acid aminotransferase
MLNKNRYYKSGIIRFKMISDGNITHTLATCIPSKDQALPFPERGSLIIVSDLKKTSQNNLNRYIFYNKILWDASLFNLKGTNYDNTLIMNNKGMLCECAYGNIFLIKGNKVITPSLSTGCYEDTFRNLIKGIVCSTGKIIVEEDKIKEEDLYQMDEIFLAGENIGIRWVMGIDNKRYLHEYSNIIHKQLNELLEQKAH